MRGLPEAYQNRMRALLGADYPAYLAAMERPSRRALRVNTLKISAEAFVHLADFPLASTGLCGDSFFFPDDVPIGRHPLHAAGLCYVQEPSAQLPAAALGVRPGMTVLDLCAAPGGKATQLAALMKNTGLLVANEPVRTRADALMGNLERLGVSNAVVTCMRPDALAAALGECFDAVLVDAPCSGEGMFRRDETAVAEWSEEHVHSCAARQRQILHSAAALLRPGGALVYSTCTFSREENEETVFAFLQTHPDFSCRETRRLYPHTSPGQGQFFAVLRRAGCAGAPDARLSAPAPGRIPAWDAFCRETFVETAARPALLLPDGRVTLPPEQMFIQAKGWYVLRAGVAAGEVRGDRFVPAHVLCMSLPAAAFRRVVPLSGGERNRFLAGEPIACDPALSGCCAAVALGYPVGWGKAVNGALKNHIPKGLRSSFLERKEAKELRGCRG